MLKLIIRIYVFEGSSKSLKYIIHNIIKSQYDMSTRAVIGFKIGILPVGGM